MSNTNIVNADPSTVLVAPSERRATLGRLTNNHRENVTLADLDKIARKQVKRELTMLADQATADVFGPDFAMRLMVHRGVQKEIRERAKGMVARELAKLSGATDPNG